VQSCLEQVWLIWVSHILNNLWQNYYTC